MQLPSITGIFPDKDATEGLPEESFIVAISLPDAAWLKWTLSLVDIGPDGEPILLDVTIDLAWTPTGDVYPVPYNSLAHLPPAFVASAHVNARQVDASTSGTISFLGTIPQLTSPYAAMFDAQQINI
ncbi:MAG: hypothetical protein M3Q03_01600 [Chloroflexota bacterium]|nr:hypothetical protein [Chloroflexota bacterium]